MVSQPGVISVRIHIVISTTPSLTLNGINFFKLPFHHSLAIFRRMTYFVTQCTNIINFIRSLYVTIINRMHLCSGNGRSCSP
ncbi:hypothetical protein HanIR_Chr15g0751411 [Helianthus annuus]|nr:hypothetical protein HanIR_Chr15g0751411 [Helianthus annuus]